MTKQEQIKKLIEARNNGDKSAQAKIDRLFESHRADTQKQREVESKSLSAANSEVYAR